MLLIVSNGLRSSFRLPIVPVQPAQVLPTCAPAVAMPLSQIAVAFSEYRYPTAVHLRVFPASNFDFFFSNASHFLRLEQFSNCKTPALTPRIRLKSQYDESHGQ